MITDHTSAARRNPIPRMPRAKDLKFLAPYHALGYTFVRNGHLKVYDPAGLLVTTIACTPADGGHRNAKASLRRHERNRVARVAP